MNKAALAALATVMVFATGCSGTGSSGGSDRYTIGIIAPTQGATGEIGQNILDGVKIAVDEVNASGGVADGHKLSVVSKDEGTSPQKATQAARDLTSSGVNLLGGLFSSADCGGVAPVIEQSPAVLITASCASNTLTGAFSGKAPFKRTFGVAVRDRSNAQALASVLAKKFPKVTDFSVFGYDYNWGHETWQVLEDSLTADGVRVNKGEAQWIPLNSSDFRSQVSAISRGLGSNRQRQGVFLATFGAGTAGFLQQAKAFDLPSNVALIANAGEYYNVARSLKGRAPSVWNAYDYNWAAFDTKANDKFVQDYAKLRDGAHPVGWTYQGYLIGLAYAAAIDKAGSADADKVLDALKGITFDAPSGSLTMGADSHQLDVPVVISHTAGSPDEPDGVKVLETDVVRYGGK
ncbi:ABC transporter substrate-binding protein [Streptomyces solisilvae]|uniref:ABC transporter substrate-binding protein n=1 Tax=Streptomyces malaysiensis TaxID=92644 RepID=UPI0036B86EF0